MTGAAPAPSIVARILDYAPPEKREDMGQVLPEARQFLESLPPSTPALLERLSPGIREGMVHCLLCGNPEEASASLYFLTAPVTAALLQKAFQFSQSCASIINRTRGDVERMKRAFEILPPGSIDVKTSLPDIMDFLRIFCIDDGQEARPLQPRTALARLRENPKPYLQYCTHTYTPHSLLDMVAEDGCYTHLQILNLLNKDFFEKPVIARQPGRRLPEDVQTMHWLSGRQYDSFTHQLAKDMVGLIHRACDMRNGCMPQPKVAQR